jgi:hypothetical protein
MTQTARRDASSSREPDTRHFLHQAHRVFPVVHGPESPWLENLARRDMAFHGTQCAPTGPPLSAADRRGKGAPAAALVRKQTDIYRWLSRGLGFKTALDNVFTLSPPLTSRNRRLEPTARFTGE